MLGGESQGPSSIPKPTSPPLGPQDPHQPHPPQAVPPLPRAGTGGGVGLESQQFRGLGLPPPCSYRSPDASILPPRRPDPYRVGALYGCLTPLHRICPPAPGQLFLNEIKSKSPPHSTPPGCPRLPRLSSSHPHPQSHGNPGGGLFLLKLPSGSVREGFWGGYLVVGGPGRSWRTTKVR